MKGIIKKIVTTSTLLIAVVGISGCATAAKSVDAVDSSAMAVGAGDVVVFGKFRLIRNGEEAQLADGLFGTSAELQISEIGGSDVFVSEVQEQGEFAIALEPGMYRVSSISFSNRGERAEPVTNFLFRVAEGQDAVYVGTVTIEASFNSGYYGLSGIVENYSVSNDCALECAARLEQFGIADADVSLMQQPSNQVARN